MRHAQFGKDVLRYGSVVISFEHSLTPDQDLSPRPTQVEKDMLSGLLVKLKTLLDKRDAHLKELAEQSEADDIVQVLTNDGVKQTGSGSVLGRVPPSAP